MSQHTTIKNYFQLGQEAFQKGIYDEAIAYFDICTDIQNEYVDAYYWRGRAFHELGKEDEATTSFEQCIHFKENYADAYYWEGKILSLANRDIEAAKKFAKCIRHDPSNGLAHYELGKIFYRANKYRKAIKKFQQCIAIKPDYPETYYYQGRALFNLKEYEEAITSFDLCIQFKLDYGNAYYWWGQVLYILGKKNFNSSNYDEAYSKYEEAEKKFAQSIELDSTYKADAYYWWGRMCYESSQYDKAVEKFAQSIKLNSTYKADAYYWWSRSCYELGQYDEAISLYEQCIQVKPDYADAYYWWGNALYSLKEYDEAAEKFAQSIKLNSTYKADAYYWWGNAFYGSRQYDEAIEKLAQSIELDSTYKADAYYWWGMALYLLKEYDEAIKKFAQSIELDSTYEADIYYWWGNILYDTSQFIEAAEKYKQGITAQCKYTDIYYWLGSAYGWLKKYEEAAKQYEKYIDKYKKYIQENYDTNIPYLIDVHYWLGRAYYNLRQDGKAVDNLAIFIEKYNQLEIEQREKENKSEIEQIPEQLKTEYLSSFYWLGLALYTEKRFPEAEEAFQEFLKQDLSEVKDSDPDFYSDLNILLNLVEKHLSLGMAFIEIKQYDQASNYYEKAIEKLNKIESSYKYTKPEAEYFQNWIIAHYYLSLALEQQKKYDLALEQYEEIISRFENNNKKLTSLPQEYQKNLNNYLTNSYFRISFILTNKKSYKCAIEYLEKAEQVSNDHAYIYDKRADIYRQQGEYQNSWQELEKSVTEYNQEIERKEKEYQPGLSQIDPSFIVDYWHNSLGNIYYQFLLEYDQAKDIYLRGLDIDPNNKNILVSLTILYLKIIQDKPKNQDETNQHCTYYSDAIKYFNKALGILENNKNRLRNSSSLIDLGNFLLRTQKIATKEQYNEIENYFLEAIEKDPNAVDAYAGLGVFYFEQDKLYKAIEYFKKAHEHGLGDFNVWSNLAETYLKQNKRDQAEKEFKDLLEINPYHVDSKIGLGQVYLAMGDAGETEMYHQAIDFFTETREIIEHEKGSRKLNSSELADLFYLQGYANFKIYQNSSVLQRSDHFLTDSLHNFEDAINENKSHYYASRAKEKIESNIRASSGSTVKEERIAFGLALLSCLILIGTQFLYIRPLFNNFNQDIKAAIPTNIVNSQTTMQDEIESETRQETNNQRQSSEINQPENTEQNKEQEDNPEEIIQPNPLRFGSPGHITLTFGSFIFMVIFLYLPRITRLSVGQKGVELEKSPLRQLSIGNLEISNLRISRSVEDRVKPPRSHQLRLRP